MDLQTMLNNAVEAQRAKEMLTSPQLTLGELILKLEALPQDLPVTFDDEKYKPTGLNSWRGSYRELAIEYEDGGGIAYEQPKPDCKMDAQFDIHRHDCPCGGTNEFKTTLTEKPTVGEFVAVLKNVLGRYFIGYKGGDFTMGKTTPLWVANYGSSSGFKVGERGYESQMVVDAKQIGESVQLITSTE